MSKIAIALSGGVDSTCAAWLLKAAGHELLALTLDLGPHSDGVCQAAAHSANELGLTHHIIDAREKFKHDVLDYTRAAYCKGLTPNPCARCNAAIKIPLLAQFAQAAGCEGLATGHYARLMPKNGRLLLAEAAYLDKSQAYFLARLQSRWFEFMHFPLGAMSKVQVRELAASLGFSAVKAKESQDCCFSLKDQLTTMDADNGGAIKNAQGKVLGQHRGLHNFTVGQRRGLGVSFTQPLYVLKLVPESGDVVVGTKDELAQTEIVGHDYMAYAAAGSGISVRLRYTRFGVKCGQVRADEAGRVSVELASPYLGVAPGQLMVFNEDEFIIGSAWIGDYAN